MSGIHVLGLVTSGVILLVLFELMRRHRLREKYAIIWFVIALGSILVALFPVILARATELLGLQLPVNLLFFVGSMLLLVLTLHHSYELGRLEERCRSLAEEVALLRIASEEADQALASGHFEALPAEVEAEGEPGDG